MEPAIVRDELVNGIDRMLGAWMLRLTPRQRAILNGARSEIIDSPNFCERVAARVGPYHSEEVSEMKKTMTTQELNAIDWGAVVAKLPAFAQLVAQIIELLTKQQVRAKTARSVCPTECHEASHAMLRSLAQTVVDALALHDCIGCCDE